MAFDRDQLARDVLLVLLAQTDGYYGPETMTDRAVVTADALIERLGEAEAAKGAEPLPEGFVRHNGSPANPVSPLNALCDFIQRNGCRFSSAADRVAWGAIGSDGDIDAYRVLF